MNEEIKFGAIRDYVPICYPRSFDILVGDKLVAVAKKITPTSKWGCQLDGDGSSFDLSANKAQTLQMKIKEALTPVGGKALEEVLG